LHDTIPIKLKANFWTELHQPDLLKEYDVIGFEASHALVKWNIDAIV
jgi:hypothetical protein